MPTDRERRKSERISHRGQGTLITSSGEWPVHIINLSEKGALVGCISEFEANEEENATLSIELDGGETLTMQGHIAHTKDHYVGLDISPLNEQDKSRLKVLLSQLKMPNPA